MNKSIYLFLSFLLGLMAAAGLLQSILPYPELISQPSFIPWFLVTNIIALAAAVFILRYYYYYAYRMTLYAALISTVANLTYAVAIYLMLLSRGREDYYLPVLLFSLSANILYALCLIFSSTREKYWLKTAGVFMFIIGMFLLSVTIWPLFIPTAATNSSIVTISKWATTAGALIPLLFIMHFHSEVKLLKVENTNIPRLKWIDKLSIVAGLLAFILTFSFGIMLASESYSSIYWEKQNFEKTKALAQLFEAHTFVNNQGDTLFYRLLKPLDYDSSKQYPLVVSLPYGGQPGTDKIRQIQGAAAAEILSTDANRKKYPAFLFIPHCPPGSGWGGISNYPSVDSLVYEAIWSLDEQFSIDTTRRYVTGISRGGYGTWNFICTHPEMFAAAIPVCGGGDPALAVRLTHVAVWAFHGKHDKNVPVSGSRDMINAIKKASGHPKYTEYPDEGHNIWYQVSITPGLLDWLFAQHRD